ncbi:hypothetical protein ABK040_002604 [Willaertia magna]
MFLKIIKRTIFLIILLLLTISLLSLSYIYYYKVPLSRLAVHLGRITKKFGSQQLEITRHYISLNNLPLELNNTKIIQVPDIHFHSYFEEPMSKELLQQVVDAINKEDPTIVVFTGDFVHYESKDSSKELASQFLSKIHCKKKFGVTGSHDSHDGNRNVVINNLKRFCNITILDNEIIENVLPNISLVGFGDLLDNTFHPERLNNKRSGETVNNKNQIIIALSHNPDTADCLLKDKTCLPNSIKRIHFMLSGHTHGGQVGLPFTNCMSVAALGYRYFPKVLHYFERQLGLGRPVKNWEYSNGMFDFSNNNNESSVLYVNRGLASHLGMRLFCSPEISVFHLIK